METTNFSTFDAASQYLVNSGAPKSRISPTNSGEIETLITHSDGSQEVLISPPSDRTFDEAIARLSSIVEETGTQIKFKNDPLPN